MIAPLDPQTRKIYRQMGYSDSQIQQAFACSRDTGIDIFDALAMTQTSSPPSSQPQQPSQPLPPKQKTNIKNGEYLPPKSFSYKSSSSFLTPWSRVRPNDYQPFFSRSTKSNTTSKIELREEDYPVGLLNVSNCCYLNSLLQCYFLMNNFKVSILTAEPLPNLEEALGSQSKTKLKRIKSEYQLLNQFKRFFTTMGLTSKKYLDPSSVLQNLVDSVGQKVSFGEQKDLSEINILIIERLSEALEHSLKYYQPQEKQSLMDMDFTGSTIIHHQNKQTYNSIFNPRQGAIKKMFYGTKVEYYSQPELQKEAPIVSDFTGLILHPRGGNLTRALDQQFNFQVQLNGNLHKKQAFIRDEPQYLFLYINSTEFDREQGLATKSTNKFTFDFTFYLDRYMQKYKQEGNNTGDKIRELLGLKNKLKEQISSLQILFKKIEQCQKYTLELEGWENKLPKEEEFQEQYKKLEDKLASVEKELHQIQSRNEEYHLMYIFVHRGDAVSGHYWGYGRNRQQWYRFDINTNPIQQDQIVIDLEKSAATPYALLYVKKDNLPNFDYKLHQKHISEEFALNDFRGCYDCKIVQEVINQNQFLKKESIQRNLNFIKDKTFNDYVSRVSSLKKVVKFFEQETKKYPNLQKVNLINNFSLFLWTHKEIDLAKFTVFQQALLSSSGNKITIHALMHDGDLLQTVQKKFKKSCHGDQNLKFYSLLPKQIQKLSLLYQEYQLCFFEVIWSSIVLNGAELYLDEWKQEKSQELPREPSQKVKGFVLRLLKLLRIRRSFNRDSEIQRIKKEIQIPIYVTQINNEVSKILMLAFAFSGFKIESVQSFIDVSDSVGAQIVALNAKNSFTLDCKDIGEDKSSPLNEVKELLSSFHSMGKKRTSKSVLPKIQQKRPSVNSGFKNSFLSSSPAKSKKVDSSIELTDNKQENHLVLNQSNILLLYNKQQWRCEELESVKINYEFYPRLINFLRKSEPTPKIYKRISKMEAPMTEQNFIEEGIVLNRPENKGEESLI